MSDIAYLDHAAATPAGQTYKMDLLAALSLGAGQTVVDVGCGPGTDLGALAAWGGQVIGVDHDPAMVLEARRRYADHPSISVSTGDAHALPLASASIDRLRLDRVLQHVADPGRVFAEVARVLRPGGLAVFADPDWDTLAIDDEDLATSRAYTRYVSTQVVRNAAMGRQHARLAESAGLLVRSVSPSVVLFTDYPAAEAVLRMADVARRAVGDGFLGLDAVEPWLQRLATAPTFGATFTFGSIVAESRTRP